jgi:hypothetical protein
LFESAITVRDLAEPFVCYDAQRHAAEVRPFLVERDFDVAGVREDGRILGYVRRDSLTAGLVGDHAIQFNTGDVVDETEPLCRVFAGLQGRAALFVKAFGEVAGIVTWGDLQKAPVRMWVFGLISLVEMQMLRLIRTHKPNDTWRVLLKPGRVLKSALKWFKIRLERNEAIDLAACLSLSAKAEIFSHDPLNEVLRLSGLEDGASFFEDLVALRDSLAHGQDILATTKRRQEFPGLIRQAERLLDALENAA